MVFSCAVLAVELAVTLAVVLAVIGVAVVKVAAVGVAVVGVAAAIAGWGMLSSLGRGLWMMIVESRPPPRWAPVIAQYQGFSSRI
eukprot:6183975-Pleurochrysis_carterae.AAC.1